MPDATPASNRTMSTRLQSLLNLLALIIRIVLWPLQHVSKLVFPLNDLDGLSPAVTAKAAQSFTQLLGQGQENWSTTGLTALREQEPNSLVLIYLYSPLHRQASSMLDVLSHQTFQDLLQQPQIQALGVSIHSGQGAQLAQMLQAVSYPLLALLQPRNSHLQLLYSIQGPPLQKIRVESLVNQLSTALTRHQVELAHEEMQRLQRQASDQLRREQDEEYHATLRADQERQRQLREQEEERQRALQREQEEALRVEQEKQDRLNLAREQLSEPPEQGGTRIRFVLPSGKKLERRFNAQDTVGVLKSYLLLYFHDDADTQEDAMENIGLSTNYPKQTYNDDNMTLEEAGLGRQAVLMVQDLDA